MRSASLRKPASNSPSLATPIWWSWMSSSMRALGRRPRACCRSTAAHPGGVVRGAHRQLLLDVDGGLLAKPHHKVAAVRLEFREKGIVLAGVTVAHIGGPALPLLPPRLALAQLARADLRHHRLVLQQMKS